MSDPTRQELLDCIAQRGCDVYDDFDVERAIYWFAADYHGGQSSNLYEVLSQSEYHPGGMENGPGTDTASLIYYELTTALDAGEL